MNIFCGILMIVIGAFLSICGFCKSEFIIYKILASRSKMLWGDNVHVFYWNISRYHGNPTCIRCF